MKGLFFLIFLYTSLATFDASRIPIPLRIQLLRPRLSCLSWRLAVETNNIINWTTIPESCEHYVGNYMLGGQYRKDSKIVADEAVAYAEGLELGGDGKDIWVFDIDETSLSNLPYFAENEFRINATLFEEWVLQGTAPPLPESLRLYRKVLSLGIKVVFLTGRAESTREATTTNLKNAGYHTWEKLILKDNSEKGTVNLVFKSGERKKLEEEGYRIVGNIGDQWSDILGTNKGNRTFKLPNPMYYIS